MRAIVRRERRTAVPKGALAAVVAATMCSPLIGLSELPDAAKREAPLTTIHVSVGDVAEGFVGSRAWNAAAAKCTKVGRVVEFTVYWRFGVRRAHYWCEKP